MKYLKGIILFLMIITQAYANDPWDSEKTENLLEEVNQLICKKDQKNLGKLSEKTIQMILSTVSKPETEYKLEMESLLKKIWEMRDSQESALKNIPDVYIFFLCTSFKHYLKNTHHRNLMFIFLKLLLAYPQSHTKELSPSRELHCKNLFEIALKEDKLYFVHFIFSPSIWLKYRPWSENYSNCLMSYAHHLKRLTFEMTSSWHFQRKNNSTQSTSKADKKSFENSFYHAKSNWEKSLKEFKDVIIPKAEIAILNSDKLNQSFLKKIWEENSVFKEVPHCFYILFLHECFKCCLERYEEIPETPLLNFFKLLLSYQKTHSDKFSSERDTLCEIWFQRVLKESKEDNKNEKSNYAKSIFFSLHAEEKYRAWVVSYKKPCLEYANHLKKCGSSIEEYIKNESWKKMKNQ